MKILGKKMKKNIIIKLILLSLFVGCANNNTSSNNNIDLYNAYGNEHNLVLHGRTVKKENEEKEVNSQDSGYTNAWNALNFFHSDEIKNKKVFLTIDEERYETIGDDEGYFEFNITSVKALTMGYKNLDLQIEGNVNLYHAKAMIIDDRKLIGIISDVDDTVVVSDVTNKTELLINTFWKNYKQREVIPTMAERFKKILADNPPTAPSRLFFLSGSPEQLFTPIEKFLEYNNFPEHTIILKQIHGKNKDSLTDQIAYKTQKIEELIALYPNMEWIMFGDSGEKDADIYGAIKEKYPSKVKAYYIRNVDSGEIALN